MPAKIVPGRNALRSISGRKAGEDHARSQGPLRGEDLKSQSAHAGQSPSVASLAFGEASSDCVGQKEPCLESGYRVRVKKTGLIKAGFAR